MVLARPDVQADEGLQRLLEQLNVMVGMDELKDQVASWVIMVKTKHQYARSLRLNSLFMGPPGMRPPSLHTLTGCSEPGFISRQFIK